MAPAKIFSVAWTFTRSNSSGVVFWSTVMGAAVWKMTLGSVLYRRPCTWSLLVMSPAYYDTPHAILEICGGISTND